MTFSKYDIVVVPFPFTEEPAKQKARPVVILSNALYSSKTGNFVGVMITSSPSRTMFDVEISDLQASGLKINSWLKPKIATFPVTFIRRVLGQLSENDQRAMDKMISAIT